MRAGLMSASVSMVCNAVMNDVRSCGEGLDGLSEVIALAKEPEGGLPRPKVCLKEANFV
jgi:hypothetical protein